MMKCIFCVFFPAGGEGSGVAGVALYEPEHLVLTNYKLGRTGGALSQVSLRGRAR